MTIIRALCTALVLSLLLPLAGCDELLDDGTETDTGSGGGGGGGSGSSDALAGPQVTYNYDCGFGTETIQVTQGPCQSSQQTYASTFGCNDVDNFYSACNAFYSCAVNNSSGDSRAYYQQYLTACASY